MDNIKVLVTGGAGSIGSNLVHGLIKEGYKVAVVDNLVSGSRKMVHPSADFYACSITDFSALDEVFNAIKPDYVFHLAAFFANQNSVDHPQSDLNTNGQGMLNVLQLSTTYKIKKLLYTSSSCVYGGLSMMTEQSPLPDRLDTPYAITKLLGESYCKFWHKHWGLDLAIVRIFNSFGPGERPGQYRNVIPNFFQLALAGKPLPITGTGQESRDFNYVSDVVGAIKHVMFSPKTSGEVINISSNIETTIGDIAKQINVLTGNTSGVVYKPTREWDDVNRRVGCNRKLYELTGFKSKHTVHEGLKHTYEWLKDVLCEEVC